LDIYWSWSFWASLSMPLKLHSSSALVDHGHTEEGEIDTHKESSLLLCSFCVHGWLMMSSSVQYQLWCKPAAFYFFLLYWWHLQHKPWFFSTVMFGHHWWFSTVIVWMIG
jgi:hypothetical protein